MSSDREKAIEYTMLAADKAWSAFSPRQAERQYRRAVDLIDSARSMTVELKRLRIEVSLSWVRVGLYNPSLDQADALRASFALANEIDDARGACLCLNWLGWVEQTLGNLSQAIEYSQGFLDAARALDDPALVSQALTNLALNYSFAGDYARAVESMERGLAMRTRHEGAAFRYAQGQFAMIVADRGDFARARELMDQALESVTRIGMVTMQAPLLVQRAIIEAWRGEFESCIESARRAYELARRIEGQFIQGVSLFLQGYGVFMGQHDAQGIDSMHKAIELLDESGMRLLLSFCLSQLAESLLLLGDLEGAQQYAERALARVEVGDQLGEIAAYRVCAVVASRSGDATRAQQDLQRALALCELRSAPRELALTQYRAAEIMAEASPEEASTMLERARHRFSELGMAGYTLD
jgi:tetratricopeptide (TPR) repeat protein